MGPLGSMVTVRDPKWITAIQRNIGMGNMYAFVVDNYEDSSALRQIMKDVFQRERVNFKFMPLIIQYNYTVSESIGFFAKLLLLLFSSCRIVHITVLQE